MSSNKNVVDLRKKRSGGVSKFSPLPFSPRKKQRDSLRSRRRRARLIGGGIIFILLLCILGMLSVASHQPKFTVQKFVVAGAKHVKPTDVEEYALEAIHDEKFHFFSPSNIFLYGPRQLGEKIVSEFPRIKETYIKKESLFSTTVHIDITERKPFAKWCRGSRIEQTESFLTSRECFVFDDTGLVFARTSGAEEAATAYVFSGVIASSTAGTSPIGHVFAPLHMQGILAFLQLLKDNGFKPIGAEVKNSQDFWVPLENSFDIRASFGASAEDLTKNLMLVLASERLKGKEDQIEYIDLRFGNKVYFKLKGEAVSE
ncbi:hypothetical protein C4568_01000 [Candidatus Parcubacteria bacterium]|nr:MAG: hypothetical protein C4568_01000 [Candidatus Parcubacteria bacterium]